VALVVDLALLAFFAEIMGLAGGALICNSLLGLPFEKYFARVHQSVEGHDLFVGLIKAPVFAFFIAVIGCMHGLRVRGSAESVGRETTAAVVEGIFLVIILDGLFSILFQRLDL
jgi:phospholipid/cholesterol/gamma-HCH transport system permease protein